jgi:hypothetical protein
VFREKHRSVALRSSAIDNEDVPSTRASFLALAGLLLASGQGGADARAADCTEPLDDETMEWLDLFSWRTSVQPGRSIYFNFGRLDCCYFWFEVPACVEWTVDPPGAATIAFDESATSDSYGGLLNVDPAVPHGTVITLTANVESGRKVLSRQFHVYTPDLNPLVRGWSEIRQIPCRSFLRGDVDQNGPIQITDALVVFDFLFSGAGEPRCLAAADSNGDGFVDVSDGIYLLEFLFSGGSAPPSPYPECHPYLPWFGPACDFFEPCEVEEVEPSTSIYELLFEADGTFRVTWIPLELYVDYWGSYTYDLATGRIRLEILHGNYIPPNFWHGDGTFKIEGPGLRLDNIWLGTPRDKPIVYRCGHRFR